MSKGIIVVYVPEDCLNCDLRSATGYCLPGHKDILGIAMSGGKPKDCPIKTLPVRKPQDNHSPSPMIEHYYTPYNKGWNDCLDTILTNKTGAGKD